jgi:N-formylglutamate deformylase
MNTHPIFHLREGQSRLLISVPHAGTYIPDIIRARLTPIGQAVVDTDWHVDKLYGFAAEMDATLITATHARTVIDLNRSSTGGLLYPGQAETGLCPTETFAGEPLYAAEPPDAAEIAQRVEMFWQPYHQALAAQIARIKSLHGAAHVLDGHSIAGEVPRLFEGSLPDLNFGTNSGAACATTLAHAAMRAAAATQPATAPFTQVLNGRFKGGFITRHYGRPDDGVHVIQLELATRTYLNPDNPHTFDPARAAPLIAVLRQVTNAVLSA